MTANRWERLKEIFDSALEFPPEERRRFVQESCGDDAMLRNEVLRLLSEFERLGPFLTEGAEKTQAFVAGEVVSDRYEIVRMLGSGGMGEVYEANDRLLGEQIALKTLRSEFAYNKEFLYRFHKEIQLARKVTSKNVCRLFEAGEHRYRDSGRSVHFFTMELLYGETLADRIRRTGPLSNDVALPLIAPSRSRLRYRADDEYRHGHSQTRRNDRLHVAGTAGGRPVDMRFRHLLIRDRSF
jgi:serine/threonine protein kinase